MSKNLFSKTYEVNGRSYTDNLPKNALIGFTKEQYIEYEQQKEEIERLKEMKLNTEKYASEMEDKYILEKNKNNKAIEYINTMPLTKGTEWYRIELLDILKEGEK